MDYFKTNWSTKIKKDPRANFILNNTITAYRWLEVEPGYQWGQPIDGRKVRFVPRGQAVWRHVLSEDEIPPKLILDPHPSEKERFRYMTQEEFVKNPNVKLVHRRSDIDRSKYNRRDKYVGDLVGEKRSTNQQTLVLGTSERDQNLREEVDLPPASFWNNVAPKQLYNVSNKHIRSNPFQAISNMPLNISTPLISFST